MNKFFGKIDDTAISRGLSFGLNENASILSASYGQEKDFQPALHINLLIKGQQMFKTIYEPVTSETIAKAQESKENLEKLKKACIDAMAYVVHILKGLGTTQEEIDAVLENQELSTLGEWFVLVKPFFDKHIAQGTTFDVFLEYQYSIKKDKTCTYLQMPNFLSNGKFASVPIPHKGEWKAVSNNSGLSYVDEDGLQHPFTRTLSFMCSNSAKQQKIPGTAAPVSSNAGTQVTGDISDVVATVPETTSDLPW